MVRLEKITGLTPLRNVAGEPCYEDNRATPLNFGNKCILGRRPKIFVANGNNNDMKGRSPKIFVARLNNNLKRGVALKS